MIKMCFSESDENAENIYIKGDNLEALKLLHQNYYSSVKMIYIDPPYNTGNDFVYKDNYKEDQASIDLAENNIDDIGNRFVKVIVCSFLDTKLILPTRIVFALPVLV